MKTKQKPLRLASATKKWDSLSKGERAVLLAKDVQKLILSKKAKASQGTYVRFRGRDDLSVPLTADARTVLEDRTCSVCAKGGLLLARIMSRNEATLEDIGAYTWGVFAGKKRTCVYVESEGCVSNLKDAFDQEMLDHLEAAFEGKWIDTNEPSMAWTRKYRTQQGRLIAIMQRVIDNGGRFTRKDVDNP